uniref:Uncharacterized protein n=1 Tax=Octopus bimaculoides TaxID=37653 RepID=A0A0L8G0V6_OCTBM
MRLVLVGLTHASMKLVLNDADDSGEEEDILSYIHPLCPPPRTHPVCLPVPPPTSTNFSSQLLSSPCCCKLYHCVFFTDLSNPLLRWSTSWPGVRKFW